MSRLKEIYKCDICGNITEVLHAGVGEMVCCGQPMERLEEKTKDEGNEKHVPVAGEREKNKFSVKVGSVPHPMQDDHHIEWIEAEVCGNTCRKFLGPGEKPEAEFECPCGDCECGEHSARCYCNIHGLWKGTAMPCK